MVTSPFPHIEKGRTRTCCQIQPVKKTILFLSTEETTLAGYRALLLYTHAHYGARFDVNLLLCVTNFIDDYA